MNTAIRKSSSKNKNEMTEKLKNSTVGVGLQGGPGGMVGHGRGWQVRVVFEHRGVGRRGLVQEALASLLAGTIPASTEWSGAAQATRSGEVLGLHLRV